MYAFLNLSRGMRAGRGVGSIAIASKAMTHIRS